MKNVQSFEEYLNENSGNSQAVSKDKNYKKFIKELESEITKAGWHFYYNPRKDFFAISDVLFGKDGKEVADMQFTRKMFDVVKNNFIFDGQDTHQDMKQKLTDVINKNGLRIDVEKLFKNTLNESLNEAQKMTFDEVADKFTGNPYGIGASRVELEDGQPGKRTLVFRTEDDRQRSAVMQKLKDMGFPANKMSKSTQGSSFQYRYELNLFESEETEEVSEAAKWPLTDKIDSSTFYNMWASLDVAAQNLSDYMDEANKGKEKDALFSLKVAYDELTNLMKSKAIEKQIKAMEAELKEKNAIK